MAWQLDISAMTLQETNKIEISMCNPTQLFERCKILKAEKDRAYAEKIGQEQRLIDETIKTNKAIALAKKKAKPLQTHGNCIRRFSVIGAMYRTFFVNAGITARQIRRCCLCLGHIIATVFGRDVKRVSFGLRTVKSFA